MSKQHWAIHVHLYIDIKERKDGMCLFSPFIHV
jgi:hypothetical protein